MGGSFAAGLLYQAIGKYTSQEVLQMIGTLEDVLKRKELRELLRIEEQRFDHAVGPARWFTALLRASWGLINAATAKQARRCQIRAYLFG